MMTGWDTDMQSKYGMNEVIDEDLKENSSTPDLNIQHTSMNNAHT